MKCTGIPARWSGNWVKPIAASALFGFLVACVADPALKQSENNVTLEQSVIPQPKEKTPTLQEQAEPKVAVARPLRLLGMSRADIIRHLGEPAFQRRDQAALLLRYREGRCILDLFLYPRGSNEPLQAVHYIEARAADGIHLETRRCIDAVHRAYVTGS